jgi:hypothetical protein
MKKKICFMIIGLLFLWISAAYAMEWVQISKDDNTEFYDKESIVCADGISTVWIKNVSSVDHPAIGDWKPIAYTVSLMQFNCTTLEYRIRVEHSCTKDDKIDKSSYSDKNTAWQNATDAGFGHFYLRNLMFLCRVCQK